MVRINDIGLYTRPLDGFSGVKVIDNGTYRAFMGPAKMELTGGVSGSAPVCETLLWGPVSVPPAASRVNHFRADWMAMPVKPTSCH